MRNDTKHLLKSKENAKHLNESIQQVKEGKTFSVKFDKNGNLKKKKH